MNSKQREKYGTINTYNSGADPSKRIAFCRVCERKFSVTKRGNALGDVSRVQGLVMAHMREDHSPTKEVG